MTKRNDYVIKLNANEIKYDVKFDTWHKGDSTGAEIAYTKEEAEDWLHREVDSAVADLEGEIAWAVCKDGQGKAQTDSLDVVPDEWVIHLRFAPSWAGSIRMMSSLAHRYVVQKVLYRWYLSADLRAQAGDCLSEAEDALERWYMMARSERVNLDPWRL